MKFSQFMKERSLTVSDMAVLIGVSEGAVSRYASGQRTPEHDVMIRIAKATEGAVEPNDFFELPEAAA